MKTYEFGVKSSDPRLGGIARNRVKGHKRRSHIRGDHFRQLKREKKKGEDVYDPGRLKRLEEVNKKLEELESEMG